MQPQANIPNACSNSYVKARRPVSLSGKRLVPAPSGDSFLQVLALAADCFHRQRTPYAVIGAWALAAWGRPRSTQYLDFMVTVREKTLTGLVSVLTRTEMQLDARWEQYNPSLRGWQTRLTMRGITIDILRARDSHDREIMRRRQRKRLLNKYLWFVSPEDFILQKLKVGRPQDFEDAVAVLERSGSVLNLRYLARWAGRLGVSDELIHIMHL